MLSDALSDEWVKPFLIIAELFRHCLFVVGVYEERKYVKQIRGGFWKQNVG
jgi:hypothetical protein